MQHMHQVGLGPTRPSHPSSHPTGSHPTKQEQTQWPAPLTLHHKQNVDLDSFSPSVSLVLLHPSFYSKQSA